jgi:hypothetical protein
MTDLRALCARMADELDHYRQLLMDDRRETHALAAEARALLAQPEPQGPTEMEIIAFWSEHCAGDGDAGILRLARYGRPAIGPVPGVEGKP